MLIWPHTLTGSELHVVRSFLSSSVLPFLGICHGLAFRRRFVGFFPLGFPLIRLLAPVLGMGFPPYGCLWASVGRVFHPCTMVCFYCSLCFRSMGLLVHLSRAKGFYIASLVILAGFQLSLLRHSISFVPVLLRGHFILLAL